MASLRYPCKPFFRGRRTYQYRLSHRKWLYLSSFMCFFPLRPQLLDTKILCENFLISLRCYEVVKKKQPITMSTFSFQFILSYMKYLTHTSGQVQHGKIYLYVCTHTPRQTHMCLIYEGEFTYLLPHHTIIIYGCNFSFVSHYSRVF